ncbi:MAG: VOC family protein [Actinomycetota bacterium]|nr:VOC family protein [Actinomycetota bacterium]
MADTVVDLVPFILVSDIARSIAFYDALGFSETDRYEPNGTLEFAALEATPKAKVMLARTDELAPANPDAAGPGFLYLYTPDLDAFRERLIDRGFETGEIRDGRPGPDRELCVIDPDGHGHMVAELQHDSVGRDPAGT